LQFVPTAHGHRRLPAYAGLLSEVALAGMFVTALEEPGRAWPVVLAILVVGLAAAMIVHLARFRLNGKPLTQSGNDTGRGLLIEQPARDCSQGKPQQPDI
jgi:hypothetical protein